MKRGRPKGYNPYYEISYAELGDWVGSKAKVQVSKKWLDILMGNSSEMSTDNLSSNELKKEVSSDTPKIEFNLTTFDNE